jgi:methionyl-tRNA formyltransferase
MRLVFMGTGEIALPTLRWLIEHAADGGDELVAVYTQPDKPVGRKQVLTPPAVKVLAQAAGIPVFQPERLRGDEVALSGFAGLRPDLAVVMAYGQILPKALLRIPSVACVNLHASLLPRHRGAAPIQAAIRGGDAETGITLMHVVAKLDAGDMILKHTLAIGPEDTGGSLHDRLAELGPAVIAEGLRLFHDPRGTPPAVPQDESLVTHTGKLGREDGEIDWTGRADDLARLIRAYDPWPGTTTILPTADGPRQLKIHPFTRAVEGGGAAPGTVLESGPRLVVQCGEGALALTGDLQLEGRRRLPAEEFLRGTPVPAGTILGSREIEV